MPRSPTRIWHPARRTLRRARSAAVAILARALSRKASAPVELDDVRPRLQRYLRAMYGDDIVLEAPPKKVPAPRLHTRTLARIGIAREVPASESNGHLIRLPLQMPVDASSVAPIERYRILAVQHAERIRRQSAEREAETTSALERDLFLLAESVRIDEHLRATQPGLRSALDAARASSIAQRPAPRWRTDIELRVETMVRSAFTDPDSPLVPHDQTTADWARRTAVALEAELGRKSASAYREVPPITLWDTRVTARIATADEGTPSPRAHERDTQLKPMASSGRKSSMPGPSSAASSRDERGHARSESVDGASQPSAAEDGKGEEASPADEGHGDDAEQAASESEQARGAGNPDVRDAGGEGQTAGAASSPSAATPGTGAQVTRIAAAPAAGEVEYHYPEWDTYANASHHTGATVRVSTAAAVTSTWADDALRKHMLLAYQARQQFERLRSHRTRLRRQVQGDELDLDACVDSIVDVYAGREASDRIYSSVRPGRRELAITLLIDVSGSTQDIVHGTERAIDVERVSALVAAAAFDALGEEYSILAFSSHGAANVRVRTVKDFRDRNGDVVRQRIAGLEPHGTTRLGAAVRHATAQLERHGAPHRLLIILSDGRPSDHDWYFVDYAIDDSHRAVIEARERGIHTFCITVDRAEGPAYMRDIFGASGYLIVNRPSQLPRALLGAVQRLLT